MAHIMIYVDVKSVENQETCSACSGQILCDFSGIVVLPMSGIIAVVKWTCNRLTESSYNWLPVKHTTSTLSEKYYLCDLYGVFK